MKPSGILFLILSVCFISAGAVTISGNVSDAHKHPVPFCSVYLKGTTVGTTANSEGYFSLEVNPGNYEIVFRSIGYKLATQQVTAVNNDIELNIALEPEAYQLKEAVVNASAEDPAYAIIRKTINMRKKYLDEAATFSCNAYQKSTQKLISFPKKIFGQEVNFGDMLDTVSKIFYLSESVAHLSLQKPGKVKEEMISSKVSGDSRSFSFNKSSDLLVSFYENLISFGNLSKRGIVSPISSSAMLYYDYRLEGTFIQNGETVNKIKVIPRRKHDPVFTGDIYILDDSWRIHSLDLFITQDQQIEFIDTFRVSETYVPVEKNVWMMLNSEFNFEFSILGFHGKGIILGVFSNYNVHPDFPKHFFDNEVLKINRDANRKDTVYWDEQRPVPLTMEENRDYVKRDSLFTAHNTKHYMDSMDEKNNKFSLTKFLLAGYRHQSTYRKSATTFSGPAQSIHFNTDEGWVLGFIARYDKLKGDDDRRRYTVIADTRYGFSNTHYNGSLLFRHFYNAVHLSSYLLGGGSEVLDFNGNAHFSPLINTGYTLLAKRNWLKLYERRFATIAHRSELFNGFVLRGRAEFSERIPLVNTSEFAWNNLPRKYLSNDPERPATDSLHFNTNQSLTVEAVVRIRFRQKYIMRPEGKSIIGSDFPQLSLHYKKAIPGVAGVEIDYDVADVAISDEMQFGLFGGFRYNISYGRFLSAKKMEFMDYHHFNGNKTFFADFSLNDFELLDYYRFATNKDYAEAHGEYNMGGLILNKIPLLRKLKLTEIIGAHYFYASYRGSATVKNYYETSFGIEKFGLLRADFVLGFEDGKKARTGFVLGLKLNISNGSIRITE
ncbi:DUF5686 and carboxypeptidase regulatory-like domain-containing protein [soil metagenome]